MPLSPMNVGAFRSVSWAGLIVDEGQRLKNDKNILYAALSALKAPFKVLLTGKITR
jgi:SNF2 family DNA or RNA helicase